MFKLYMVLAYTFFKPYISKICNIYIKFTCHKNQKLRWTCGEKVNSN